MKWIWTLLLAAAITPMLHAGEELSFPFDRTTRITFIRLGNTGSDAGQQFVLRFDQKQWSIERRISRTEETMEQISTERAEEILMAFSSLYDHWHGHPYFDNDTNAYSLFVSIGNSWRTVVSVKDRGSPELSQLLDVIQYPSGLVLAEDDTGKTAKSSDKAEDDE